jgi:spore germination protein KC
MNITKLFTLLPLIFLLTSCVGEEPNDIAYVTAIGIDKAESGYIYTIQFANPTKISGGAAEEGGSGGEIVENISVYAPTIYSAVNNANTIVSKNMSLSHAKVVVVSETVARNGLNGINDVLSRNNDIRPDVYIAVAENAGEYLEEVKPAIELNPTKYYQLTYGNRSGSSVPQNTAFDFFEACISGSEDCVIPLAGVTGENSEIEKKETDSESSVENDKQENAPINRQGFENGTKSYLAGEAGEKVKNKSEIMGMAVFDGDKYITKLGNTETELYNIMMGSFKKNNITFYSNKDPEKPITVLLEQKKKPIYKLDINNKRADIYIVLEWELMSAASDYRTDYSVDETNKYTAEMVNNAAKALIKTLYCDNSVDSLGICGRLKKQFVTIDKYEEYKKTFVPNEWSINVHTDMRMKRTGMTYY